MESSRSPQVGSIEAFAAFVELHCSNNDLSAAVLAARKSCLKRIPVFACRGQKKTRSKAGLL